MRVLTWAVGAVLVLGSLLGCGGNPYGYAPEYVPLSDEEAYDERGLAHGYEDVRRDPVKYKDKLIAWFGVVQDVQPVPGKDQVKVAMELRFHQERHLCSDQFDDSCRVTISEKPGGPFSAIISLRPDDRAGRDRVHSGSLLKIYGKALPDYDERGGPLLATDYYRHWPLGTYVNTARSANMRR
jgi:hypothetical protein